MKDALDVAVPLMDSVAVPVNVVEKLVETEAVAELLLELVAENDEVDVSVPVLLCVELRLVDGDAVEEPVRLSVGLALGDAVAVTVTDAVPDLLLEDDCVTLAVVESVLLCSEKEGEKTDKARWREQRPA